ncbi:MAG: 50S ribosomal protein L2 [Candidatus Nanohaloarchaeota archaeon QJJ-7]|nr:50S ribosomal protein L2 [Candidatus Nanohaloarchaeota archaeon QJJ-7]
MSKRIRSQRRGKGSPTYTSPSHTGKGGVEHREDEVAGTVVDIVHDPARTAPVAIVEFDDGEERNVLAPEGVSVGDDIEVGIEAPVEPGNTLPLREIPEGVPIYNIELEPGDGGKIARSSGTYAFIVTHESDKTRVRLPSKNFKDMDPDCRATIGQVAGGGRTDKEFEKAGQVHHKARSEGKLYPKTSAIAMNAVDHPFGGSTKPGRPKTVSKDASPGSKVGSISPKRTGRGED